MRSAGSSGAAAPVEAPEDDTGLAAGVSPAAATGRVWPALRTLVTVGVTLVGLLLVTFLLGRVIPADPVLKVVGDRAPQELYDKVYHEMRLDQPVLQQFVHFADDMLHGRFGKSLVTGNPIGEDIVRYFPATFELATLAILLGVAGGIPLAVLCVRHQKRWPDHLGRIASLLGHSMPIFWLGIVGLLVLYAQLGWVGGPGRLDVSFRYSVPDVTHLVLLDSALAGDMAAFANAVSHTVLPAALLGLVALGYITRMVRGFLIWQMRRDYVMVLRLKGLTEHQILWRHALPNAAGPTFAVIALTYAYLLEGAVLTETVFAWPGLGMYITDSLFAADMPAVLAATLLVGLIFMVLNICAELVQAWLDPRIRVR